MWDKAIAVWLFVLTLSPFTAPFSTCDLTTFLADPAPVSRHETTGTLSLAASPAPVSLLFRTAGRVRFVALSATRTMPGERALPSPTRLSTLQSSADDSHRPAFTILRI